MMKNIFSGTGYELMDDNIFGKTAIAIALKKMFDPKKWFDICCIDKAIKILGVNVPETEYISWSLLHCVHWDTVDEAVRQEVFARVMYYFGQKAPAQADEGDIFEMLNTRRLSTGGAKRVLRLEPPKARVIET